MSVADRLRHATSILPCWISSFMFDASAKYFTATLSVFAGPRRPS